MIIAPIVLKPECCVKARMIFGLKKIPVQLVTLLNDDEETPVKLIGKKMVPILEKEDGILMPESMDIVHYIDQYKAPKLLVGQQNPQIADWLASVGQYFGQLVITRYAKAKLAEFATLSARQYFINKKELTYGAFSECLKQSEQLIARLNDDLMHLSLLLTSEYTYNEQLSDDDIHLFAILRGISIVKGVHYPANIKAYQRIMAEKSGVNLYTAIAI